MDDDIKYLWLIHRTTAEKPLLPEDFKKGIYENLLAQYQLGWTVCNPDGRPVGIIFGQVLGPVVMLGSMFWMPWATKRNKMELAVKFLADMRKHFVMLMTSSLDDKPFYEYIAKHGVIRRVGTLYGIIKDEPTALFQTREIT